MPNSINCHHYYHYSMPIIKFIILSTVAKKSLGIVLTVTANYTNTYLLVITARPYMNVTGWKIKFEKIKTADCRHWKLWFWHYSAADYPISITFCTIIRNKCQQIPIFHCRTFCERRVKSSQVYFFNSRIKYTAKLHDTKLYSEIYTVTHNKFIQ